MNRKQTLKFGTFPKESQTFFEAFAAVGDLVEDVAVVSKGNEQGKDGEGSEDNNGDECNLGLPSVAVIFVHFDFSEEQKP